MYDCLKAGDVPGVDMVMVDGKVLAMGDQVNTAPTKRSIVCK